MDATGKVTLETPEQIGIEFEVAGIGSRFLAALIDLLYMLVFLVAAVVAVIASTEAKDKVFRRMGENLARSEAWTNGLQATAAILLLLSVFVVQWGYYIIGEMVTKGASPGKRAIGLRVIRDNGLPLGFSQSLLRNLVRLVDFLPWGYGLGLVSMFVSARSQRLGDLVAGTLVVRVEKASKIEKQIPTQMPRQVPAARLLTADERQLIERYFERRKTLLPDARAHLLTAIVPPLRARLAARAALPGEIEMYQREGDEAWLERLAALDAGRGGDGR